MTQTRSKAKAGKPKVGGRAVTKGERREAMVMFRTTPSLKALAERVARSEGRSLANFLEQLIWAGCREGLGRAAYQAAGEGKTPAMEFDAA